MTRNTKKQIAQKKCDKFEQKKKIAPEDSASGFFMPTPASSPFLVTSRYSKAD